MMVVKKGNENAQSKLIIFFIDQLRLKSWGGTKEMISSKSFFVSFWNIWQSCPMERLSPLPPFWWLIVVLF
jgi:hypothetical protein